MQGGGGGGVQGGGVQGGGVGGVGCVNSFAERRTSVALRRANDSTLHAANNIKPKSAHSIFVYIVRSGQKEANAPFCPRFLAALQIWPIELYPVEFRTVPSSFLGPSGLALENRCFLKSAPGGLSAEAACTCHLWLDFQRCSVKMLQYNQAFKFFRLYSPT